MRPIKTAIALTALSLLTVTGSAQNPLTNGLIAFYSFNNSANDTIGTNHGTVFSAMLAPDRFGFAAQAYWFNGTNAYIRCPDTGFPSGNAARTLSLWLNISTFGNPPSITYPFSYGVDGATDAFYAIVDPVNSGGPYLAVGRSGGGDTPRWDAPQTNVWYQLVITYTNSTTVIYVNGVAAQASRSYATTLSGNFYIGRYVGGFPPTFYGSLDDVRVYNRSLSASEVAQLFATEAGLLNVRKAVYVDSGILTVGSNYQLQVSSDLATWTNQGAPFTATNSFWRSSTYWDVDDWHKLFFRLRPQ